MIALPEHIELLFFGTLKGETSIQEFEQWLYSSKELETILPEGDYLDFISLNYKTSELSYELAKLISKQVDTARYETWKLKRLLSDARYRKGDYPLAIIAFYDLYCSGYRFLENLALGFGLPLKVPLEFFRVNEYDGLSQSQRDSILQMYYPTILTELSRVEDWLDSGKVLPTGLTDEFGRFGFLDKRTEAERKMVTYTWEEYIDPNVKKKWWEFWK